MQANIKAPTLSEMVAAYLKKGRQITQCRAAHAATAAPREHTGGLDRYQFRAVVRFARES
jgi:hypothetical protein